MPIYKFECEKCGHTDEIKANIDFDFEAAPVKCCGESMTRVICAPTVVYKGAGFYTTENRGITGHKRKPNIKVGTVSELSEKEQDKLAERGIKGQVAGS
jgi:putative FmdB family regulatory protein